MSRLVFPRRSVIHFLICEMVPIAKLILPLDLAFAGHQFPLLTHLTIYDFRSEGIPSLRATEVSLILPSLGCCKICKTLDITVVHLETNIHSSAWKVRYVVVFAYQFLARCTSNSRFIYSFISPQIHPQSPSLQERLLICGLSETLCFLLYRVGQKTIEGGDRRACPSLSACTDFV